MTRAGAAFCALALILTAAGCGREQSPGVATAGGPAASASAGTKQDRARQYAQCLRDNGVELDDAAESQVKQPGFDKQRHVAAFEKCREFAPQVAEDERPSAQQMEQARRYAVCMRENGMEEWPDPDPALGVSKFPTAEEGLRAKADPNFPPAVEACRSLLPTEVRP